jgi:tRNA A-37 threonylcarbamoyl transferase component Bud32
MEQEGHGLSIPGFKLARIIGQGGMGRVYEGIQVALNRRVAVKVLAPELVSDASLISRFRREVQILTGLASPHIVKVIDTGEAGGTFYYAMEFCEGGTLKAKLRAMRDREQRYAPGQAVELACSLLEGLEAMHGQKVVHRDIKPGNIFFAEGGRPVLGDFGLARDMTSTRLTVDPQAMGTPLYMSPEARVGGEIDERSDVFQVGRVLYEALSGEDPNQSAPVWIRLTPGTAPAPLTRHNPRVSDRLAEVVARSLEWDPAKRQQSAHDLRQELASAPPESSGAAGTIPVGVGGEARFRTPQPRGGHVARQLTVPAATPLTGSVGATKGGSGATTRPPRTGALAPVALFGAALVTGLATGVWFFRQPPAGSAAGAVLTVARPNDASGDAGDAPRVESLRIEFPGPWLELTCAPAAAVEVEVLPVAPAGAPAAWPGRAASAPRPPRSETAVRHRIGLGTMPAGRHMVNLKLDSPGAAAIVPVPLPIPFAGRPPTHCLGMVLKECFEFASHTNQPSVYDDELMEGVLLSGASAVTLLVDPERDDPGLEPLVRAFRRRGIELTFCLYTNRFPADPARVKARLSELVELVAGLGQPQLYFAVGILIDTNGWVEGFARYSDFVGLVRQVGKAQKIPVSTLTGNLLRSGTESLEQLLAAGTGAYVDGIILTHRYPARSHPGSPFALPGLDAIALRHGVSRMLWIYDVPDPEDPESEGSSAIDHELLGPVLADPGIRDVAAAADQRAKREALPRYDAVREEAEYGVRMRETARLLTSGVRAVMWDVNVCRDPAQAGRLLLRTHPLGIRMLLDFLIAGSGSGPEGPDGGLRPPSGGPGGSGPPMAGAGDEVQLIRTETQRNRFSLSDGPVRGAVRESPAGVRLLLWSDDAPKVRVGLRSAQAALVTPLVQPVRTAFSGRLVQPVQGKIEVTVGWAPVLVDLLP